MQAARAPPQQRGLWPITITFRDITVVLQRDTTTIADLEFKCSADCEEHATCLTGVQGPMPSTPIGVRSFARPGRPWPPPSDDKVFHDVPYADTSATDREPSSTAAAISAFARTVNLARGGICGTDSVNCLRSQKTLRHTQFCW